MGKYDRLGTYLREQGWAEIPMTFTEIERVVGTKLPKSQEYPAWWSNSVTNNVMTKVWLDAGYETSQVDARGRKLVFKRIASGERGMSDVASEFKQAENTEKKPRRSPLFGALKGTFWIDPEWDLTKPALSGDELAEWDASLDRKAVLWFGKK